MSPFASRAGQKLDHALSVFAIDVAGRTCADLGCNVGGFVDCLLQRGATKVYAVDTGYGVLDWKLRRDARVVVMERTNAMHLALEEPVSFVSIDVAWTRQRHILPAARKLIASGGDVVTLVKPHYEAEAALLRRGVLAEEHLDAVVASVSDQLNPAGFELIASTLSPIRGAKGNAEMLMHLRPLPGGAG
jgi:23S rRNA (cytidine1920-2'-O)/16S rRNA (cytidine1409-2'-O)-methyltransferase